MYLLAVCQSHCFAHSRPSCRRAGRGSASADDQQGPPEAACSSKDSSSGPVLPDHDQDDDDDDDDEPGNLLRQANDLASNQSLPHIR